MREHLPKPLELERLARSLQQWCPPRADAVASPVDRATPVSPPALDPLRWQALAEYDDAHGSLRRELASDFLAALSERTAGLERAATAGHASALELAAHGLRGAADNLGLSALGALGRRLEETAQEGRIDTELLGQLRTTSNAAVQALEAALAALTRA
jgi:two-component system sensor histidine kinase EvgS